MKRFFTADWHLCSNAVFQLGERPYRNLDVMNERIIQDANMRAHEIDDVIYHLGDFYNECKDKSFKCYKVKPSFYLDKIKAKFVLIEGNHDVQNDIKCIGKLLYMNLGGRKITMGHLPTFLMEYPDLDFLGRNHIHLCGHVHKKWKIAFDKRLNILNVNVGLDMWKYRLVSEKELIKFIDFKIREENNFKLLDFLYC